MKILLSRATRIWQFLLYQHDLLLERVGHPDGVAPRLSQDIQTDGALSIDPGKTLLFLDTVDDAGNVGEMNDPAPRSGDNHAAEIFDGCVFAHRAQ